MAGIRTGIFALCASLALAACGQNRDPDLLNVRTNQEGPDEFAILPSKPLELPESFAELPQPVPGGPSRSDADPRGDAARALGGTAAGGTVDPGLVAYAGRFGVAPEIRAQLAREDLEFRRANDGRLLERLLNVNVYFDAYERQSLDKYRELARLRRLGVRTPSAPPESVQ